MARLVYRGGRGSKNNLTPRLHRDLQDRPGQSPGLSTFDSLDGIGSGKVVQVIDLDRLRPPLRAFPDRTEEGGTPGHVSIAPATAADEVDSARLEAWARTRETDEIHEFTTILKDAIVEELDGRRE